MAVNCEDIRMILSEALGNEDIVKKLSDDAPLIGAVAEMDSLAIANIIAALEDHYEIQIDEMDIQEAAFSSINSLVDFTQQQNLT